MDEAYGTPGASSGAGVDLLSRAKTANTLGIISVILCMMAPCASCVTLLAAFPLSLVTVQYARAVLAEEPDEVTSVYARTGMTMGVVALVYSGLLLMLMVAYVMLYFGLILLAIAGNM